MAWPTSVIVLKQLNEGRCAQWAHVFPPADGSNTACAAMCCIICQRVCCISLMKKQGCSNVVFIIYARLHMHSRGLPVSLEKEDGTNPELSREREVPVNPFKVMAECFLWPVTAHLQQRTGAG